MSGKFKMLTKELKSYSRSLFRDIYELRWNDKLNKPEILLDYNNIQGELRLTELAEKYYLFDIDQCQWIPDDPHHPDPKRKMDVIVDKIKEGIVLVSLTEDGHIKGYCRYSVNIPDKSVYVEELFTVKEYQRTGVADELLSYVEKIAITQYKCDLMMLNVHSNNLGAIKFYNKFGLTEPKDVMFSTTPTYSAYIFQEVANIWSNKFLFIDDNNSDSLHWYDWMNRNKGKGNCYDYAMYVAYIAYKLHKSKVVICSVELEKNSQTKQFRYNHIVPIYYEDGNWVLINYLGSDNDISNIYTFAGNDDLETVTKFIDQFSKAFLPIMTKHMNIDYKSCEKVIKISKENRVRETIDKFYGKEISQKEILDYLFDTDDISLENYDFSMENNDMKTKKYRYNNKRKVTGRRRFKCMDCGQRFAEFNQLKLHAERYHQDLIQGEDIYKYLYEKRNPGPYICTICKKRPRVWNDKSHKYSRICDNPECAKKSREIFSKNMKKVYGTDNLAKDPEYQTMLLANRSITKVFEFPDGGKINCVGEYELDLLNYLVKNYNYSSLDIVECPASLYVQYYDVHTERKRYYIPDFFIPKYNLVIEVKDGSKYPVDSKAKAIMKEQAVVKLDKFNYIKIVDKDYSDFDNFIKSFEENHFSDEKRDTEHIFIIPESHELL